MTSYSQERLEAALDCLTAAGGFLEDKGFAVAKSRFGYNVAKRKIASLCCQPKPLILLVGAAGFEPTTP